MSVAITGQKRERLEDLDLLRLLAIVLVVARVVVEGYLAPPEGTPFAVALRLIGLLGAGLFFFISGYLLQRGYPSIETSSATHLFFNRRAWRIFPLYWVALLVAFLLSPLVEIPDISGQVISASDILVHVLGLQMVFPMSANSVRALWFIGTIVIFYLWYPVLVYRRPSIGRLLLRALAVLLIMGIARAFTGLFAGEIFEYFPIFVLGVAAGTTDFLRADRYRSWRLALAVAAVPVIGYAYLSHSYIGILNKTGGLSLPIVLAVGEEISGRILAIFCFVFLIREAYVYLAPRSPYVLHLITAGTMASYAVYIFQGPYLAVVASLAGTPPATVFAASVASLPVLFVACYYLQKATDRLIAPVRLRGGLERK